MMVYSLLLLKFALLTMALVFGAKYVVSAFHGIDISRGCAWRMAIGVAGFISVQWLLP